MLIPWLLTIPGLFSAKAKPLEAALFLGAAIAITAFPMLARIIHERGLAGTSLGTLALTAGVVDDAAAWCILAIVLVLFALSAFAMDAIGIHAVFGGFLLGVVLPRGALTERLRAQRQPFAEILSTLMATPLFDRVTRAPQAATVRAPV